MREDTNIVMTSFFARSLRKYQKQVPNIRKYPSKTMFIKPLVIQNLKNPQICLKRLINQCLLDCLAGSRMQ